MLQKFRNKKTGQIGAEYVVLIMIVLAVVTAMFVYVKRTYQGRARDARRMMIRRAAMALNQNMQLEYEPYYVEAVSNRDNTSTEKSYVTAGGYVTETESKTGTVSTSKQLPPGMFQ